MATTDRNANERATAIRSHMSESFLEHLSSWTGIATAVLTALAAVAGLFAWVFSSRLSEIKDGAFKKFREESNLSISRANRGAAEASEKAAALNARAATLEQETAEARLELEQLKEKQRPRTVDKEQATKFKTFFAANPLQSKVAVFGIDNDFESIAFANSITLALKQGGVDAFPVHAMPVFGPEEPERGVAVLIKSEDAQPSAFALQRGLREVGIPCEIKVYEKSGYDLLILVGIKP